LQILEGYRHRSESPLACGLSVFGGDRDQMVKPDALEAWRCQTHGEFTFELLAGDHFVLHASRQPMLAAVARVLDLGTGLRKLSCP
jgi:surfactin synthase thioesterase subunit